MYAEEIGYKHGEEYDVENTQSESVKMLSEVAKQTGTWLIGGTSATSSESRVI